MSFGITAFGGYVPRLRLQRSAILQSNAWFNPSLRAHSKGERAVGNWDEDAVTMAVEAARDCLTGFDRDGIKGVFLASTSLPFADRQNSVIVKEALNLQDAITSVDVTSGQRAGTSALYQACLAAKAGAGPVLCMASDRRKTRPGSEIELLTGDAAAAFTLGTDKPIAELIGQHSTAIDFVDHYRGTGEDFDYIWESRWIRDEGYGKLVPQALKGAFAKFGFQPADVAHFILPSPFRGVADQAAKAAGIPATAVRDNLGAILGDAASAQPLVMLAHTLQSAKPGDKILLMSFGQGCDVLAFQVTDAIKSLTPRAGIEGWLRRRLEEKNYTKFLFFNGLIPMETGIRSEQDNQTALTVLYRNRKAVMGLVGGRCTKTGAIQFPKSRISVNPQDHAIDTQEDYPLADRACKIMTFTADMLAFTPDPPLYFGTVVFEEGGRLSADFTDVDPAGVEVGAPMKMMFRIKAVDEQRMFTKYFWKAAPAVDVITTREG